MNVRILGPVTLESVAYDEGQIVNLHDGDAAWLVNIGKATVDLTLPEPEPVAEPVAEKVEVEEPAAKPRRKRAREVNNEQA